jgi:hypothetical protein
LSPLAILARGDAALLQQGVGKDETPSLSPPYALRKGERDLVQSLGEGDKCRDSIGGQECLPLSVGSLCFAGQLRNSGLHLAHKLQNHFTTAGTVIEIDQNDLLPRAGQEFLLREGNLKRGSQQSRADMREAVAIAPTSIVRVAGMLGHEALKGILQVLDAAGLKLQGGYSSGRARNEDGNNAAAKLNGMQRRVNLRGDVDHITEAACGQLNGFGDDGHG